MSDPSDAELMERIRVAGRKPDAAEFSRALNDLRFKYGYLSDSDVEIIQGWIGSEFPSSIRYLARELLKGEELEDEDEKEREEKIPSWDARNICSSSTQNDLIGGPMPRDLREVVSFLLPSGGKSECLTESDLRSLLRPKDDLDEIYLFDPSKPAADRVIISAPVHRLPSSGVWILGSAPYLRMLKTYQLESFGKHSISAKTHTVSGIYNQVSELFLAKPLHYDDFKALIVNNTALPPAPAGCACIFKPRMEDWSETFRVNYPIKDCEWLIPTWNGFPVALGKDCNQLLHWDYAKITPPTATRISVRPERSENEPIATEEEIPTLPTSFKTGVDFLRWMQYVIHTRSLQDSGNGRTVMIIPGSGDREMGLYLMYGNALTVITPSNLMDRFRSVRISDSRGVLSKAKVSITNIRGGGGGGPFVSEPWNSGNINNRGKLVMEWKPT